MKKSHLLLLLLVIILAVGAGIFALTNNRGSKTDAEPVTSAEEKPDAAEELNAVAIQNNEVPATEAPASAEQVAEEFNAELSDDEEPLDPDSFSEYTEDYVIELQEDEVVEIN